MDPVSKFFKAVLEEFNNLKNGVSYVWHDALVSFDFPFITVKPL